MVQPPKDASAAPRITAIEPLPSDPNVRRVRVDGRTAVRLRASDVEALKLKVGRRWTDSLSRRAAALAAVAAARTTAMSVLGRRAMSHGELIARLVKRGHDGSIAERVADELAADRWIDDAEYARSLAQELARGRGASQRMIVQRLLKRHVDANLAERAAADAIGAGGQVDLAVEFAAKRMRTMAGLPPATAARRIAGALARRGYEDDVVAAALARLGLAGSPDAG
jgi:regulatory protein